MAPHVFIEPVCLQSIDQGEGDLREHRSRRDSLGRYHRDARKTFYGWADVWLDPNFVQLGHPRRVPAAASRCPVLAIQGDDDEYGTMAQLDDIARAGEGRCELLKLRRLRPQRRFSDQPEKVLSAIRSLR